MAHPARKRKCPPCKGFFHPDHRNVGRQLYCSKPECRHVSKTESQRRWLQKPENLDHFKGDVHVQRVRQWRLDHPGYWRRKAPEVATETRALQDSLTLQPFENQDVESSLEKSTKDALQDSLSLQSTLIIGLISHLTGLALQEDIEIAMRRLQQLGRDISSASPPQQGDIDEAQIPHLFSQTSTRAEPVQLGGSAPGP
jgi:hypothetical protein